MNVATVQTSSSSVLDARGRLPADDNAADQFSDAMASARDSADPASTDRKSSDQTQADTSAGGKPTPDLAPQTATSVLLTLVAKALGTAQAGAGGGSPATVPANVPSASAGAASTAAGAVSTAVVLAGDALQTSVAAGPSKTVLSANQTAAGVPAAVLPDALTSAALASATEATTASGKSAKASSTSDESASDDQKASDTTQVGQGAAVTAAPTAAPAVVDPAATLVAAAALAAALPAQTTAAPVAPPAASPPKAASALAATPKTQGDDATQTDEDSGSVRLVGDVTFQNYLAPASVVAAKGQSPHSAQGEAAETAPVVQTAASLTEALNAFALGAQSSELSPVVGKVANAVVTLAQAQLAEPATSPYTPLSAARTMTLQLAPADLGTISVRLHVTGSSLDVQLQTSESGTAALLGRDRDALAGALRDQNYHLHSLEIGSADGSASAGGNNGTRSDGGAASYGGAQSGSGNGSGGTSSRDASGDPRRQSPTREGASGGSGGARNESDADLAASSNGGVLLV